MPENNGRSIGLNPFEIRAGVFQKSAHGEWRQHPVSIPLKSGQGCFESAEEVQADGSVSIPLKSGQGCFAMIEEQYGIH